MHLFSLFRTIPHHASFSPDYSNNSSVARYTAAAILFFFTCLNITLPAAAGTLSSGGNDLPVYSSIPSEYGETIFWINKKSVKQLYIIGISHREAENRTNNADTVQTQTEIFRIGEWLNKYRDLNLLLPEGYFSAGGNAFTSLAGAEQNVVSSFPAPGPSNVLLYNKLADESYFVNAEMLLMEYFNMHASQVEEENIYNGVLKSLGKLRTAGFDGLASRQNIDELLYLQQKRTAILLQKIPGLVEAEFLHGTISNRIAMFTIGLNHIQDIIRYLENNMIRIHAPSCGNNQESYNAELDLLNKGYGVAIIIPRTLADNRRLLQKTNLDSILLAENDMPTN